MKTRLTFIALAALSLALAAVLMAFFLPIGEVSVPSYQVMDGEDGIHFSATVANATLVPVRQIEIRLKLFDASGALVSELVYCDDLDIPPKGTGIVSFVRAYPGGAASFEIRYDFNREWRVFVDISRYELFPLCLLFFALSVLAAASVKQARYEYRGHKILVCAGLSKSVLKIDGATADFLKADVKPEITVLKAEIDGQTAQARIVRARKKPLITLFIDEEEQSQKKHRA